MDFIKVFEEKYPRIHDNPKYIFRRTGEFYCTLIVQANDGSTICEIVFGENDLIDLIMKAEMLLHGKEEA
jgi:hypothetical protein